MEPFSEQGIDQVMQMVGSTPASVRRAIQATVNASADATVDQAVAEITNQVNLSPSYVRARLKVRTRARGESLDAVIGARSRGTGLIRFDAIAHTKAGKTKPRVPGGVSVKVKAGGGRRLLPSAFFIDLKRGNQTGGNNHLAYRPKGAKGKDTFKVLYGPSVSQVWNTVRNESGESPEELMNRFYEQLEKIAHG